MHKIKIALRRCVYVVILILDLAALRTGFFAPIPGGPYVLWLLNLLFASAADFLREQPGWRLRTCWLRRMVYATTIFFLSVALYLLYILVFIRSDAEMSVSPGS